MIPFHLFCPSRVVSKDRRPTSLKHAAVRWLIPLMTLILSSALAACGGAAGAPPAAAALPTGGADASTVTLTQDYPNAVSVRNQLLIGTFRLEGTADAITAPQAAQLVPLWQMLKALSAGTGSQAEVDAVLVQIQRALTAEQIQAIRAMGLTTEDNQALFQSLGITLSGAGSGGGQPGQGAHSPSEQATRQVEMAASGNQVSGGIALDKLIELLKSRQ